MNTVDTLMLSLKLYIVVLYLMNVLSCSYSCIHVYLYPTFERERQTPSLGVAFAFGCRHLATNFLLFSCSMNECTHVATTKYDILYYFGQNPPTILLYEQTGLSYLRSTCVAPIVMVVCELSKRGSQGNIFGHLFQ